MTYDTDPANPNRIPENMRAGIDAWVSTGVPPGGCLRAMLENDLRESFARADHYTAAAMHAIVAYLYNRVPAPCWGSPAKVAAWQAAHDAQRDARAAGAADPPAAFTHAYKKTMEAWGYLYE